MPNPPPTKNRIRDQLDADMRTFLRNGGKISHIDHGETSAKPMSYGAVDVAKNQKKGQNTP